MDYLITKENRLSLCDEISEKIVEFCQKYLKDKKEILRYRLTAEEYLLNWLTENSLGKTLSFECGKKALRKPFIELSLSGEPVNPTPESRGDEMGTFGSSVLHLLGLTPLYSYKKRRNILRFELNYKKVSSLQQFIIVILAAVIVGAVGLLLPDNIIVFLRDSIFTPVYNKFFDLLGCVAGPMIFLSVAWGVYGIGDASTLSRVGKRMLLTFIGTDFIACCIGVVMVPLMGLKISNGSTGNVDFTEIFNMILDIIPANIVEPFSSGNTLQIIFMGFSVGIAMLFLGKCTESVAKAVNQVNLLIQFMMKFISGLVPYVIFLVIVNMFWSESYGMLVKLWRLPAVTVLTLAVLSLLFYVYTSLVLRVKLPELMKKSLPSFLIALVTASSAAAFSSNVDVCKNKFGISESMTNFGVPLTVVIHKPMAAITFQAAAFFFAAYCGVECSVSWLVTAVFLCTMMAVATPPVPGGGAIAFTVLWTQLGIPAEILGVALAVNVFMDFACTSCEMYCLPAALANVAIRTGMLDEKILRKSEVKAKKA